MCLIDNELCFHKNIKINKLFINNDVSIPNENDGFCMIFKCIIIIMLNNVDLYPHL